MAKIAVTGAAGTIGKQLCADLARDHEVVRIDLHDAEVAVDVQDLAALERASRAAKRWFTLPASSQSKHRGLRSTGRISVERITLCELQPCGRYARNPIMARNVAYAIVYGVGNNATRFWDLEAGRAIFGFWPHDGTTPAGESRRTAHAPSV